MFEGAELIVYSTTGEELQVDLSAKQLFLVMKVLGIEFNSNGSYNCFSDNSLDKIASMKGNPLRLVERVK